MNTRITAPMVAVMMASTQKLMPIDTWSALNSQRPINAPMMPTIRSPISPKPLPLTILPASQPATMPTTRMTSRLWPAKMSMTKSLYRLRAVTTASSSREWARAEPVQIGLAKLEAAALALDQPDEQQQDHGADHGVDDRADDAADAEDAQPREQPAGDQAADDADHDVAEEPEA